MVFQQFNLFNNHNVLGNCTVGQIKVLKRSKQEAEEVAMKYLKIVGMEQFINAKPKQLSGDKSNVLPLQELYLWNLMLYYLMSRLLRLTQKW